jgi:hypothetical protein
VKLLASNAFCDPSLDSRAPGLSPIVYEDVEPGEHQVFCRMPGGEKVALGGVHVPARERGEHTIQIVKVKETGRPQLAAATRPRQPDPGPPGNPSALTAPPK